MKAVAAIDGTIRLQELEPPSLSKGHLLIRTEYSAISPGTELSMARKSQNQSFVLGYSAAGVVEEVGEDVTGWEIGQRAACYGAPYVRHAELLSVPANLAAPVPGGVKLEEAAFAGLGAIAIHALRVADLRFGESAAVVGLGILGNLIAQIANAAAFRTAGLDVNEARVELLRGCGVAAAFGSRDEFEARLAGMTGGTGFDSVILCAGGSGEKLINDSFRWLRDRGKIIIVGDLTAEFSRGDMFAKEAQVLISRAGGPGRYDAQYEQENRDYPIGYVRWTEGRNTAEYVRLLAEKRILVAPLITGIYPVEEAAAAFGEYAGPSAAVGTVLAYGRRR